MNILSLERYIRAPYQVPVQYRASDILLASFPKSGSTWLRFIISNIVRILNEEEVDVDFHSLNYYSPHIVRNRRLSGSPAFENTPRFLKTHFYYNGYFSKYRKLLLVRNPEDTLVSYFHYIKNEVGKDVHDFEDFVRHWRWGCNGWNYFHSTWLGSYDSLVHYEELRRDPVGILSEAFKKLNFEVSDSVLEEAIKLSSKENMRTKLKVKGDPFSNNNKYEFVGTDAGRTVDNLCQAKGYIQKRTRRIAERYGYVK